MTRRPSMSFYTSDWLGGTALMSCAARGAYITMLAVSWEQGPIPATRTALFKAMGVGPDDPGFDELWDQVRPKWTLTAEGWINQKLERVREARDAYCAAQAAKGRKGGRPPKMKADTNPELSSVEAGGFEKLKAGGKPKKSLPIPIPIPDLQSPDPSPDPCPVLNTQRALCVRTNGEALDVELRALMTQAVSVGIPLQRFLLDREFLPQASHGNGAEQALEFVQAFVAWAIPFGRQEVAAGPLTVDPAKWWRQMWAGYGRVTAEPAYSWHDECERQHGAECQSHWQHGQRMQDEAAVGPGAPS